MIKKKPVSKRLEDIYKKVLETISEHILYYDKDFKIIWANKTAADSLNLTPEQLVGKSCYNLWFGRSEPCEECPVLKALKFGELSSKEMITPDGRLWYVEGYPVFNHNNKISGVVEIARDITERKAAEQKLKDSEDKYRNVLENMLEGYFETDLKGTIVYANVEHCKILGYSKEELIGKHYHSLYDTKTCEVLSNIFTQVYKTGIPWPPTGIVRVMTLKKKLLYLEGLIDLLYDSEGNKVGFYGLVRDVTERKIAEQKLKESEEKYRNILENMMEGYYETDLKGTTMYANVEFCKILGYSKEELIGKDYRLIYDKKSCEVLLNIFTEVYKTGVPRPSSGGAKVITLKKKLIYLEGIVDLLYDSEGNKVGFYGLVRDVTERKIAEQRLKKSEEKYRNILENMMEGYYETDLKGTIVYANVEYCKIMGYSKEEVIGKDYRLLYDKKSCDVLFNIFTEVYKTGIPRPPWGEAKVMTLKKKLIFFEGIVDLLYDSEGNKVGFYGLVRDIKERKIAEQKLKESEEKYREAFNRTNFYKDLIAHDINNILQNILSCVELCLLYVEEEKDVNELIRMLKMSKQQVGRAANLISNTRKLSRLEEIKIFTQPIEVIEILNQSIDFLLKSYQDKKINIDIENPYKTIRVQANELLVDVFENILINAVKYTQNFPVEIKIKVSKLQKDGLKFIKFEFEDNGIGIPDTNKESIFQRAYNLDEPLSGMGIGLSLVRKILTTYKGQIWVEDKVKGDYSKGSNFVVLIPEV